MEKNSSIQQVLNGGGCMGELIRKFDWSSSQLGPVEEWPQSLVTAISIVLSSRFPMILFWGPQLVVIYNDAYIPIFGARHPALGKPAVEAWGEVWDVIFPMFEKVFSGEATWSEDQLLLLTRNHYLEECYFTWSYSPIRIEDGSVGGILTPITETTTRVLSERRLLVLRELGSKTMVVHSVEEACRIGSKIFNKHKAATPFSGFYLLDGLQSSLKLICTSCLERGSEAMPERMELGPNATWPAEEAFRTRHPVVVSNLEDRFGYLPGGLWPESSRVAVVIPIFSSDQGKWTGILILGTNPRRPYDDAYRGFFELLARQMTNAIAMATSYEEEKKRAEELAAIDRAKTIFFSNVSHEFRTPLTLMIGPLEDSLADNTQPLMGEQRERQTLVHRNTLRLLKLVNSLLDFSRIEAGRVQAHFEPTDLASVTLELASVFRSTIKKAGLHFIIDTPPLNELVYVDREMWEKIIFNLLSNAFKFTLEGQIKVSLRTVDDTVETTVEDTGVGIPESELPHLFERFHRVEGVHGRSYEGTGIGLALIHELVRLHGGSLRVKSKVGEGSSFTVSIPLGFSHLPQHQLGPANDEKHVNSLSRTYVEEANRWLPDSVHLDTPRIRPQELPSIISKGKVLLVDDNADMRQYVTNILGQYWEVEAMTNGEEALQAIQYKAPDLVLSDIMMPKMDGFQLLSILRSNPKTKLIPVILLSARAGEESKVEGLQQGADDYLVKPFSAKELVARVNTHMELGKLRLELERRVAERTAELTKLNAALQVEIQERKQAENSLRESEERYKTLAKISPVGIFRLDTLGKTTYVNEKWTEITGLNMDEGLEKGWDFGIIQEDKESISSAWKRFVGDNKPFLVEFRYLRKDGLQKWTLGQIVSDVGSDGVRGYVGSITDITERKQLEQQRLEAVRQAEYQQRQRAQDAESNQKKQEYFIDMICHEIRNPLNGICNNLDLLKSNLEERVMMMTNIPQLKETSLPQNIEQDREAIDAIELCAHHQRVVTDDVLHLSKLEAKKVTLCNREFQPKQVIDHVVKIFDAVSISKGIKVVTEYPDRDISIVGDPDRLTQILMNLLSNAIKFTEKSAEKCITITLKVEQQVNDNAICKISVKDTGIGMTEQEQSTIFNRFAQANINTYHEYGGSGLGLSICKALVELMLGHITVQSAQGKGSEFSFTFSCKWMDRITNREEKNTESSLDYDRFIGKRILIVDDNTVNQKVLKRHLVTSGFHCDIACNGQEAVLLSGKNHYELIIMDIEMPILNGLDATRSIRDREKNSQTRPIPIIGLSGNARTEHVIAAIDVGMNDYVIKPYVKEKLLEVVSKHLNKE